MRKIFTSKYWRRFPHGVTVLAVALVPVWSFDMDGLASTLGFEVTPARLMPASFPEIPSVRAYRPDDVRLDPRENLAPVERVLTVGKGDTLIGIMIGAGVPSPAAHGAVNALAKVHDLKNLRPGHEVRLSFHPNYGGTGPAEFRGVTLHLDPAHEYTALGSAAHGFRAFAVEKSLTRRLARAGGEIRSSLYDTALAANVPLPVLIELIRIYSWDVDFQRDVWPGDRFDLLFERHVTDGGVVAREGRVLYANLVLSGVEHALYQYTTEDGDSDYFNTDGHSARKALLRTPIDGARLSSGYGKRRHPVLGYTKMHRGVDFAAPRGTPIYAAGDGRIASIGRNGAYGNYIRIRHNGSHSTAYGHMTRFAKSLKKGSRVRQGQVIGYVGTTGRSTGPHLHYEILKNGQQTNPMKVRMPSGKKLTGKTLEAFNDRRATLDRKFAGLPDNGTVALGE